MDVDRRQAATLANLHVEGRHRRRGGLGRGVGRGRRRRRRDGARWALPRMRWFWPSPRRATSGDYDSVPCGAGDVALGRAGLDDGDVDDARSGSDGQGRSRSSRRRARRARRAARVELLRAEIGASERADAEHDDAEPEQRRASSERERRASRSALRERDVATGVRRGRRDRAPSPWRAGGAVMSAEISVRATRAPAPRRSAEIERRPRPAGSVLERAVHRAASISVPAARRAALRASRAAGPASGSAAAVASSAVAASVVRADGRAVGLHVGVGGAERRVGADGVVSAAHRLGERARSALVADVGAARARARADRRSHPRARSTTSSIEGKRAARRRRHRPAR